MGAPLPLFFWLVGIAVLGGAGGGAAALTCAGIPGTPCTVVLFAYTAVPGTPAAGLPLSFAAADGAASASLRGTFATAQVGAFRAPPSSPNADPAAMGLRAAAYSDDSRPFAAVLAAPGAYTAARGRLLAAALGIAAAASAAQPAVGFAVTVEGRAVPGCGDAAAPLPAANLTFVGDEAAFNARMAALLAQPVEAPASPSAPTFPLFGPGEFFEVCSAAALRAACHVTCPFAADAPWPSGAARGFSGSAAVPAAVAPRLPPSAADGAVLWTAQLPHPMTAGVAVTRPPPTSPLWAAAAALGGPDGSGGGGGGGDWRSIRPPALIPAEGIFAAYEPVIFVPTAGALVAVSSRGAILWTAPVGNCSAAAAIDDGDVVASSSSGGRGGTAVVVGTADGVLHRVAAADGTVLASCQVDPEPLRSAPAIAAGGVAYVVAGNALRAIAANCTVLLTSTPANPAASPQTVADTAPVITTWGTVVFTLGHGLHASLATAAGSPSSSSSAAPPVWSHDLAERISSPAVSTFGDGGAIFVQLIESGGLAAYRADTGVHLWSKASSVTKITAPRLPSQQAPVLVDVSRPDPYIVTAPYSSTRWAGYAVDDGDLKFAYDMVLVVEGSSALSESAGIVAAGTQAGLRFGTVNEFGGTVVVTPQVGTAALVGAVRPAAGPHSEWYLAAGDGTLLVAIVATPPSIPAVMGLPFSREARELVIPVAPFLRAADHGSNGWRCTAAGAATYSAVATAVAAANTIRCPVPTWSSHATSSFEVKFTGLVPFATEAIATLPPVWSASTASRFTVRPATARRVGAVVVSVPLALSRAPRVTIGGHFCPSRVEGAARRTLAVYLGHLADPPAAAGAELCVLQDYLGAAAARIDPVLGRRPACTTLALSAAEISSVVADVAGDFDRALSAMVTAPDVQPWWVLLAPVRGGSNQQQRVRDKPTKHLAVGNDGVIYAGLSLAALVPVGNYDKIEVAWVQPRVNVQARPVVAPPRPGDTAAVPRQTIFVSGAIDTDGDGSAESRGIIAMYDDGSVRWFHAFVNIVRAPVVLDPDGRSALYVGDRGAIVHALDTETGAELWQYAVPGGGAIDSSVAIAVGGIVVASVTSGSGGSAVSTLHAVRAADGEFLWSLAAPGPSPALFAGPPVVSPARDVIVVAVSTGAQVMAISAADAAVIWVANATTQATPQLPPGTSRLYGGVAVWSAAEAIDQGSMMMPPAADGPLQWVAYVVESRSKEYLAVHAFSSEGGTAMLPDPLNLAPLYRWTNPAVSQIPPVATDNQVYFALGSAILSVDPVAVAVDYAAAKDNAKDGDDRDNDKNPPVRARLVHEIRDDSLERFNIAGDGSLLLTQDGDSYARTTLRVVQPHGLVLAPDVALPDEITTSAWTFAPQPMFAAVPNGVFFLETNANGNRPLVPDSALRVRATLRCIAGPDCSAAPAVLVGGEAASLQSPVATFVSLAVTGAGHGHTYRLVFEHLYAGEEKRDDKFASPFTHDFAVRSCAEVLVGSVPTAGFGACVCPAGMIDVSAMRQSVGCTAMPTGLAVIVPPSDWIDPAVSPLLATTPQFEHRTAAAAMAGLAANGGVFDTSLLAIAPRLTTTVAAASFSSGGGGGGGTGGGTGDNGTEPVATVVLG
jgi:outer membrane protein assembly factor BamB